MVSCDMQKTGFVCFGTPQCRGEAWLKDVLSEIDRIDEFIRIGFELPYLRQWSRFQIGFLLRDEITFKNLLESKVFWDDVAELFTHE